MLLVERKGRRTGPTFPAPSTLFARSFRAAERNNSASDKDRDFRIHVRCVTGSFILKKRCILSTSIGAESCSSGYKSKSELL